MNPSSKTARIRKKFEDLFWWTPIIGVPADILAILGVTLLKEKAVQQQPDPASALGTNHKVWGFISLLDIVIVTGIFTLFIITIMIYRAYMKSKSSGEFGPYIPSVFSSIGLSFFYLRLFLGGDELVWFSLVVFFIVGITSYSLLRTIPLEARYRVGCVGVNVLFLVVLIFLFLSTDVIQHTFSSLPSRPEQSPVVAVSEQPPVMLEAAITQAPPDQPYVSYMLLPETWFPEPAEIWDRLSAGDVDTVTNEEVASGENLQKYESWGRITSFQRFYTNPEGCNTSGVSSAYVQIIFFQTPEGAIHFFDWAHTGEPVTFVEGVGERAYQYSKIETDGGCQATYVSTTFQQYNVIARARAYSPVGKLDYGALESISLDMARLIEARLQANVE